MLTSCSPVANSQAFKGALAARDSIKQLPYLIFETSKDKCRLEDDAVDNHCIKSLERKRRLTTEQVSSLERNFEVEYKLEPELKEQLAKELGLKPRQVAVWFQNRRARWKTKQMEKDYNHLKAKYDALKYEYNLLLQNKKELQLLVDQVLRLNEKLQSTEGADSEIETLKSETKIVQAGLTLTAEVLAKRRTEDKRSDWNSNSAPSMKGEDQKDLSCHSNKSTAASASADHRSYTEKNGQGCTSDQASFMPFGEDYLSNPRNLPLAYQISAIKSEDSTYQENRHFDILEDQAAATLPWWDWP